MNENTRMGSIDLTKELLSSIQNIHKSSESHRNEYKDIKQQYADIQKQLTDLSLSIDAIIGKGDAAERPDSSSSSLSSNGSERIRIQEQVCKSSCMRDAIQQHIVNLVESLPFKGTKIPDLILEKGITDFSDTERLRNLHTSEDQISGLLSHVLRKDKACMDIFLEIIEPECENIVQDIKDTYNSLVLDSDYTDRVSCSICEIKHSCDVKWVYNHLFEKKLIASDLPRKIAFQPNYVSCDLWDEILPEIKNHPPAWVISVLIEAVERHDTSNGTLLLLLKRLFRKGRQLRCNCRKRRLAVSPMAYTDNKTTITNNPGPNLQTTQKEIKEHIISGDKSNVQQLESLKHFDEQYKEQNLFLSEQTGVTIQKTIIAKNNSNEYETIWSVQQNRPIKTGEKEPIPENGEDQLSPELTRKGSGSNETQVKRAIGDHDEGKKFHKNSFDRNKFNKKAIRLQASDQKNDPEKGTCASKTT